VPNGNARGWRGPGDGSRRRTLRRLAAVLVVVGVLFAIYRADRGAWNASWQATFGAKTASQNKPLQVQFDRLRDQLRTQVPPDHTIYVDIPNDAGLWTQRIGEFAAMSRLYLVSDRAQADYVITLTSDPSAPMGVRIVAHAAR
jgi:hypothetical protein